jgi:hypothetical protein
VMPAGSVPAEMLQVMGAVPVAAKVTGAMAVRGSQGAAPWVS